jgi:hypothetical protein
MGLFHVLVLVCVGTKNMLSNKSTHGKWGCMEDVQSITRRERTTSLFPPTSTHFLCFRLKSWWFFYEDIACCHVCRPYIWSLTRFSWGACIEVSSLFLSDHWSLNKVEMNWVNMVSTIVPFPPPKKIGCLEGMLEHGTFVTNWKVVIEGHEKT